MLQNRDHPRATVKKPSSNRQAAAARAPLDGLSPPKLGFGGLSASVRQAHLLTWLLQVAVPRGIRAERSRPGVRDWQRAWRFRSRERTGRRGACWVGSVRIRPHGIRPWLRREWLWLVHWRNGHGCPSAARLFPVCGREFSIRRWLGRGQRYSRQSLASRTSRPVRSSHARGGAPLPR
jgi:hypothetical protein